MNPDSPKTPQEEMETRLLALLLGELPEEEAAAWRAAIATNPELAKLHNRLTQTVNLVREATAIPAEPRPAKTVPVQLSENRREKLRAHFKTVAPEAFSPAKRRPKFTLVELTAAVAIIAILAAISVPMLTSSKREAGSVTTAGEATTARLAADTGLERARAEMLEQTHFAPGSNNFYSVNVVGYVNKVLPPQSTRGDSTLSINPLLPAAEPPVAATPAPAPTRRKQVVVLPTTADSASAAPAKGVNASAANEFSWSASALRGSSVDESRKANEVGVNGLAAYKLAEGARIALPETESLRERFVDPSQDRFNLETHLIPVQTASAANDPTKAVTVAGRSISPSAGLPVDNLSVSETVGQPLTVTPEQDAFRKRYGLSAANSAGGGMGGGGGGGARGGGLSVGGVAISPQPNAWQQTAGDSIAGFAYPPAPAAAPALQTPPPPSAIVATPVDALGEKAAVLGDLPTFGKAFRSEPQAAEMADPEITLHGLTASSQGDRQTFFRQLSQSGTDAGVTSTNSLNFAFKNEASQGKSGGDALTTFGVNADADGLARSDNPQQQKLGDVRLANGSVREASRSKLQDGLRNSGSAVPDGGRIAAEPPVLGFDVQDLAKTPTAPEGRVAATDENGVRQQRGSSIVLPQVEQEIARVPAYEAGRAETLTRGRAVPARPLRASESEIAGKLASTVAPAQAGEQLLTEDRLNNTVRARPMSVSRMPSDAARQRVAADKKEKADVIAQVTDARVLLEAGKVADAEAKLQDAIKADPENAAANYYLALTQEPRAAATERGLERDAKRGIAEDELLPLGVVNFSAMDVKQALSIYGELSGKTVLQPTNLTQAPIALKMQPSMTKQEAIQALNSVLASNGIEIVNIGDKFVKAMPLATANSAAVPLAQPAQGAAELSDVPVRKPSANAPIPQPEIQTSENNFSTFSLNVSDVSFKLAAASLEKGQMPDPASVRSEEFINAFDYHDPEPPPGAPIAFAWERARYPFAHNRDLLRFSLKTAAAGRQAGRPLNIVLLLDNSGSMERADRVRIIREALRVLASQLQPQDKLSVITFARTARLVADGISGDKAGEVTEQISGLTPQGGTNLEDAMNLAYQTALRHYLANGINRVVLLTDGAANLGNVEPESLKQKVEAHRKQGVALDCFGIGWEGFNDDLLEVLSRNGDGRYGFINSPEEAASEFAGQLAGALKVAASDVKVQVEFNPKRVTSYRQIGYAKHQLTKEQFRDNTVDAAEIAAQEAGNALYTVEVNPAGEGPLCTVRVRFRFAGTWEYHEQAWDVPYTGNAVSLEQSSPAMHLAASASAFAEWLVASPFAGEVTPDRLLGYLSGVPEVYGADSRSKKLEWMIRQVKSIEGSGGSPIRSDKPERLQFP